MTDALPIICRRCGFANVPGDQFCGSCGAFLEWEGLPTQGEPAEVGAAATPSAMPPVGTGPAAPTAPVVRPAPALAVTPATAAAPSASAVDAAAGLVRCPACGIANPATRTFCQSCGATLAQASQVAEPSAAAIAAAVARPAAGPRADVQPVAGAALRAAARTPSRGIPVWVLTIGGLGIVVGVVVVAASMLLGGKGPGTGATSAPGSGAVVSPSPGSSAASGQPSAEPSSGAPAAQLVLTSAKASSVVGNRAKFAADMAIDGDPATCWQEGSATEKGQWIEVTFDAARVDAITLYNGYQQSDDAFFANLRLKDVTVTVNGGKPIAIRLKDSKGPQRFDLGGIAGATRIRITIVTTYASKKTAFKNSPFDDAALSEIVVEGAPG